MTTHLQTTAAEAAAGPRLPEALRSRRTGQPVDLERGVLTVAFGSSRYTRMARILADSLELHCPELPRALVTDSQDRRLLDRYDVCVPYDEAWGRGFVYKFFLNDCSPFRRTLYIDADCIVVGSLDRVWELFEGVPFGVEGRQASEGYFAGDVAEMCRRLGVDSIPRFNGGMYAFDDSPEAQEVFATGRRYMDRYAEVGLDPMARGWDSDEPVFAMALASHGIRARQDFGTSMRTPIGIRGQLHVDVLRGYCRFNKEGEDVTPVIVHFADWRTRGYHYNREALKLAIARRLPWVPRALVSVAVTAVLDPVYHAARIVSRPLEPRLRRVYRRWAYRGRRP